ncbi:MAG: radical SAM protein [Candidatus Omnitrophica bacterium]|nr:radical SAM protein [Candidatus Omnitrophota bacterium]
MKEIQYRTFSLDTHLKNKRHNVCQFELTFGCGLHCKHCYTECYNTPEYRKDELKTDEVKRILDRIFDEGILWLCFTGGDPLMREDFLEIYSYAKGKGFIITIFTSAYSLTEEIAQYLEKRPPFVVEVTLNGVTKDVYEAISQVQGSFDRVMNGVRSILSARIPLKIKTQVTTDNLVHLPQIKEFVEGFGLQFRPDDILYARLNGDVSPCSLRISPDQFMHLHNKVEEGGICGPTSSREHTNDLFRCAIAGRNCVYIDPHGKMFLCTLIREPSYNVLKDDIERISNRLLPLVHGKELTAGSQCYDCEAREYCLSCPGRALVETGAMDNPVTYYCELAKRAKKQTLV